MPDQYERTGRRGSVPLVLVVLLVLGAFALLLVALAMNEPAWAWGSVAASAVAGMLLITDWITARDRSTTPRDQPERDTNPPIGANTPDGAAVGRTQTPLQRCGPTEVSAPPAALDGTVEGTAGHSAEPAVETPAEPAVDPAVEVPADGVAALDPEALGDLGDEVVVIDERPRYHLAGCAWVGDRRTIPLPVREARELGFTPCAVCTPDARLAARHRAGR